MSYALPRHRKPPRSASMRGRTPSKHRKPQARRVRGPALALTAAAAATLAGGGVAAAVTFLPSHQGTGTHAPAQAGTAAAVGTAAGNAAAAGASGLSSNLELSELSKSNYAARAGEYGRLHGAATGPLLAAVKKHHRRKPVPAAPVYLNPLRAVTGLMAQRIDMGADFAGSGPIYPIGDAVITSATGSAGGWPGGGWITYQLTDGPASGLVVYVAEDVRPTVPVGEKVTPATEIASMFSGTAGIETGWAMPDGASAESQLAEAGGIGGGGPFPTKIGVSFDALLQALGVPAAPNAGQAAYGLLPANFRATWPGLR